MKQLLFIGLLFIVLTGCNDKVRTFEELQKAKWDRLAPGLYSISTKDIKGIVGDSLEIKIKEVSGGVAKQPDNQTSGYLNYLFPDLLKLHLPHSQTGYLRINLKEMMKDVPMYMRVFLDADYEPTGSYGFSPDSAALMSIPGIEKISYTSKAAAKGIYLDAGNPNWETILDSNPLPASIEITLDNRIWTEESLQDLKKTILKKIHLPGDVSYPLSIVKSKDEYYYFEYTRK